MFDDELFSLTSVADGESLRKQLSTKAAVLLVTDP
jgi:hypothetical protein